MPVCARIPIHVYGYLCDLIQANHPMVLCENPPRIVSVFAEAFYREAMSVGHAESLEVEENNVARWQLTSRS